MIQRNRLTTTAQCGIALALLIAWLLMLSHPDSIIGQADPTTSAPATNSEAPTSLEASVTPAGVSLNWSPPTLEVDSVVGYRIDRRRVLEYETSWLTLVANTGSATPGYIDATANVNSAEYEYRVSALRGEGDDPTESGYSNVASVDIPNPPRPLSLTATSTDNGVQLTWAAGHLSWQAVSLSLSGYEIRRIETAHPGNRDPEWEVLVANTNSSETSYLDATGYTTIEYSYVVRAVHGYLHSYWEGIAGPVSGHLNPQDLTAE